MQQQLKTLTTAMGRAAGIVLAAMLFMVSCNNNTGDQAIIPIPKDTSALGKIDHFIPRGTIDEFEAAFKKQREQLQQLSQGLFIPYSETFNKQSMIALLQIPDCVGLRILYGVSQKDSTNTIRLMLVGVNSKGENLYLTEQKPRGTEARVATDSAAKMAAPPPGEVQGGEEHGQCYPPCPKSY
jgi:hypothetical protein